jgi:PAS domain S-box-containing protein
VFRLQSGEIVAVYDDITERKVAEEALAESEERFRNVITATGEYVFEIDAHGVITFLSDRVKEILGYEPQELIGKTPFDIMISPEEVARVSAIFGEYIRNKLPIRRMEHNCLSKDGRELMLTVTALPILDAAGEIKCYQGTVEDITGRKRAEEALKESEQRYQTVADFTYDWEYWMAPDGKFVYVSPSCERITGYRPEEFTLDNDLLITITHADDRDKIIDHFAVAQELNTEHGILEFRIITRTGEERWIGHESQPVYNANGGYLGRRGSNRDITDRKRVEEALRESEEKFRIHIENSFDVIFTLNSDGEFVFVSPAWERHFGYPVSDVIGKSFAPFVHPEDIAPLVEYLKRVLTTSQSEASPAYRVRHADGRWLWFIANGTPIVNTKGEQQFVGVGRDITERKVAEEALRLSEQKLSSILNDITDVVWSLSWPDMNFHYISPSVEKVYGRSLQEFIDKPSLWAEITHPDDKQISDNALEQLRKAGSAERECRIVRPDGSIVWIHDKSKIIFDQNDNPIRVDGITSDITERKELEKEMEYHALELRQFSTTLAAANKKLTLLSSITRHDINNQLTVLMGFLAILKKKQPDPTLNEYCSKASNAAQRISAMIQFTKEYDAIGVSTPVWQDVRTVLDTAAKQAPLGKVVVKNDLPAGQEVFADPLIVKVFYNLMDNAVRYGGKITTVRFSVEKAGDDHVIICEDDGDGVVAEEKEKIFDRGFGKNTGLGLALAREILDITGITIRENGELGKGARFEMTVPKGAYRLQTDKGNGQGEKI